VTKPATIVIATEPGYFIGHIDTNRRVIASYRSKAAGENWDAIASFVRASVTLIENESTAAVRYYLTSVSKFALWAYSRGLPIVDPADILNPATVFRYVTEEMEKFKPSYRAQEMGRLQNLLLKIGDPDTNYPRAAEHRSAISEMEVYTAAEQTAFVSSCNNRSTKRQRSNMRVLLGLGFGAGLKVGELNNVRTHDIQQRENHHVVRVPGARERVVPIRADWVPILLDGLADRRPDDYALLGYRHETLSTRLAIEMHLRAPNEPHPAPSRMRSTWIVEHLTRGLRPDVLASIAGLGVADSFRTYVPRMPAYDLDDYVGLITGGEM
jgi:integrase